MGIFDKLFGSKKEEKKATVNRLISEPLINKEPENILQEIDFDLIDKAAEDDRISSNTIMHDYDFIKLIGQKNYIEESKSDEQIEEFILTFFGKQKLEILTAKIIQFNFIKEFLGVKLKDLTLKYKNKEFSGYKEIYMWHNCAEWAHYVIQKNLINMAAEGQEIKDVDPSVLRNLMSEVIDEAFEEDIESKPETPKTPKQESVKSENNSELRVKSELLEDVGIVTHYKGKPFTGIMVEVDKNGVLVAECKMVEGLLQDTATFYFENGEIKKRVNYVNDKLQGAYVIYHENGELKETLNYHNDKLSGVAKIYNENGILEAENNFKDGEANGLCKTYDEKGKLIDEVLYLKGRPLDDKLTQELLYGDLPDDTPLDSL